MEHNDLNLLRQVVEEGFGNADLYVMDQIMSDHLLEHQFGTHGGKEGLKKSVLSRAEAFLDRNYELVNHTADGNMVWVHYPYSAVHTGPFLGHAPTHKKFTIDVMDTSPKLKREKLQNIGEFLIVLPS